MCLYINTFVYICKYKYVHACINMNAHDFLSITCSNTNRKERIEGVEYMELNIPRHNLK
jgi:hypothetical protein